MGSITTTDDRDNVGWSASLYNKSASFVYSPAFTAPVLDLLSARPGERIIDLGCGSGEITVIIDEIVQQAPGGLIVAVDYSESMVNMHLCLMLRTLDIPVAAFSDDPDFKFDAVFSNASLALGVKKYLKPGGRLVVEMGGSLNCIGVRSALHRVLVSRGYTDPSSMDPWFFPSTEDYTKLLVAASFEPLHISLTPRITPLEAGVSGWLEVFVRKSFLRDVPDKEATEIMNEVEEMLKVDCQDSSGNWAMVYSRLRFAAVLKEN
ncbi:S-adenosyl-L-methionine-dependent methyltransferase [Mycena rebaudengoi]|nr:S-adenosyl-L-methionine-dependent methyltransferase [Mycena rebaudengoi]